MHINYFHPTSPPSYALPAEIQSDKYITTIPGKIVLAAACYIISAKKLIDNVQFKGVLVFTL